MTQDVFSTMDYVMGLDIGSSDCKALVVDKKGSVIGKATRTLEPFFSRSPKWAEQHPSDWWKKICNVINAAIHASGVPSHRIGAIGLSTQRNTFVAVDEELNVLRPAILWLDKRTPLEMKHRIRWIREYEPDIFNRTHKFLGVHAWLASTLTGTWTDSAAAQFAPHLQDPEKWNWDREKVEQAGIDLDMLPELRLPGKLLGEVTAEAAGQTGLTNGMPVIAGCGDKQSGTLGAGCISPDMLMISYGTAISVGSVSERKPRYPILRLFSPVPYKYNAELGMPGGFWLADWFRKEFYPVSEEKMDSLRKTPLQALDDEASKVPPGSQGLVVLPHWWGGRWGEALPHSEDRGAVVGWTSAHTRGHFYRAILEGLIQETRNYKEMLESNMDTSYTDIRVVDGGSKSDFVMQMTADVLGCRVSRIQTYAAEALGAAIIAAKGIGLFETVEDAVKNMVHITRTFKPIPSNKEAYEMLYSQVYSKLYWKMKVVNASIDSLGF